MDRRGFLRGTVGGAAALLLVRLLPGGSDGAYADAAGGSMLHALSPTQYATARAAAEALLEHVPVPPARVAQRIDYELAMVGDPIRSDMRTVLTLLQRLTPLGGHLKPFTELSPEQRRRYLMTWAHSRFDLRRGAFQAVRAFVYFYAYSDAATRPITGFEGPWTERFPFEAKPVDFGEVT
jgi:hypothetical protein